MGNNFLFYFVMTLGFTIFWSAVFFGIGYAFYVLVWKPNAQEREAKKERLRRYYDRRG